MTMLRKTLVLACAALLAALALSSKADAWGGYNADYYSPTRSPDYGYAGSYGYSPAYGYSADYSGYTRRW
jgi:hypothetical protein